MLPPVTARAAVAAARARAAGAGAPGGPVRAGRTAGRRGRGWPASHRGGGAVAVEIPACVRGHRRCRSDRLLGRRHVHLGGRLGRGAVVNGCHARAGDGQHADSGGAGNQIARTRHPAKRAWRLLRLILDRSLLVVDGGNGFGAFLRDDHVELCGVGGIERLVVAVPTGQSGPSTGVRDDLRKSGA